MVSPPSRRLATPLLLLLLSSTAFAQYTLRGRVVQDHHTHNLGRRAEPSDTSEPLKGHTPDTGAGDDDSGAGDDGTSGAEASSSTHADKGEVGGDGALGDENQGAGDDKQSEVCRLLTSLGRADD
jgi:hypothetical protein